MNFTTANVRGFILTTPSLENVGSSTMLVSLDRLHSTRKSMEPLSEVGGVMSVNTISPTRNMNQEHW